MRKDDRYERKADEGETIVLLENPRLARAGIVRPRVAKVRCLTGQYAGDERTLSVGFIRRYYRKVTS
jgi:hypothetical protein